MANVFLIGLESRIAVTIARAAWVQNHAVFERPYSVDTRKLLSAGIIFAGGDPKAYLTLLRRVRRVLAVLPFIVVTAEVIDLGAWLDALDAGATDYCGSPIAQRQVHWLMESLMPKMATGTGTIGASGQRRRGRAPA